MHSSSAKAVEHSQHRSSCFVLAALLVALPSHGATKPRCTVQAVNYQGWKAEQMANRWLKLEIVPQIGGRLMQVTFGGHDYLFYDPQFKGQLPGPPPGPARVSGGDKIWPLPEGNQDEQHWAGGGPLDQGPFALKVMSHGASCTVRLTGPEDPTVGQQYFRDISIGADSPVISFHLVMKNVTGYPRAWSEQSVTQYNAADPGDPSQFNPRFWGVTPANPRSAYSGGYHVRTGPADNPAFSISDGLFRVQWHDLVSEVWVDSPGGWLAVADGTAGYAMVERTHYDPRAEYPGNASMIFYTSGLRTRLGPPAQEPKPPVYYTYMEAEVDSPLVELGPGESYAMDTQWYPTRMGLDFKTATWAGVVSQPLTATATPAGLLLSGSFGVFYAGNLVVHYYGRGVRSVKELIPVTPTELVQLQSLVRAPPGTTRVSLHLLYQAGLDRGPLGEVLVNPPPQPSPPEQ